MAFPLLEVIYKNIIIEDKKKDNMMSIIGYGIFIKETGLQCNWRYNAGVAERYS